MKQKIITIGNKIYCRLQKNRAKVAYKHGYDILHISIPERTLLSPHGLEWYVLNRNSNISFEELVKSCTMRNPAFYVQVEHVKIEHGRVTEAIVEQSISEIF